MYDELTGLGMRLRDLRKKRGMTLAELAKASGLTAGLLSRIENARTSPSLPVLCGVARVLGCSPGELFDLPAAPPAEANPVRRWRLVRRGQMRRIERENSSGYDYRLIFESRLNAGRLEAMYLEIAPGARRRTVTGEGVESLFVLKGHCFYQVGADRIELNEGDTLFFDSTLPHVPDNPGPEPVAILVYYYLNEKIFGED